MAEKLRLPIGIEDFKEIRTMDYYYVDKTGLLRTLLKKFGKVNLFTRPRRFGKTLNMSMIKYFLEMGSDNTLFDGLEKESLLLMSSFLEKHHGQKVIILIDEYDVPLDKAYQSGYYDAMVELIRSLFGEALKTNNSLYFAVLTGCLRISKESIFTGLNNFSIYTVKNVRYNEYFGFTDKEVRTILEYYKYTEQYDVIRRFIDKADASTKDEIELLINGGSIRKEIHQELTYKDLDSDIDHLWSLLFTTGYLTQTGEEHEGISQLIIPNKEIHWIYVQQIRKWFKDETKKDKQRLKSFCMAFQENDVAAIEEGFTSYLKKTISIRDTNVKKEMKENFYHGILLGLFGNMDGWKVKSNTESGEGYCDIVVEIEDRETGIIIEFKYAENAAFDEGCRKALKQIKDRNYEEILIDDGMKTIYRYGIACYKKRCKVISG